jgi:hypothetical protein
MIRFLLAVLMLVAATLTAAAQQAAPASERPVTAPDSTRIVMENERVRIIEFHVRARSKVNVEAPAGRERFLYMLTDGALVLAPPGRAPYEFVLHAGESIVFPAVSPTVENASDQAVRAMLIELKQPTRVVSTDRRGKRTAKPGKRGPKKAVTKKRGKPTAAKPRGKKRR